MRFIAPLFALLASAGCADPCTNTLKAELVSPDGKYVATAFVRDCGATTSYSPQVHLRPFGEKAGMLGNVFIGNRSDEIRIVWLSAGQLVIDSDASVVRHEALYHGVRVDVRTPK